MARNIVPLKSVIVEIVEDRQAWLIVSLGSLTVIGLSLSVSTGVTPIAGVTLAGRSNFSTRPGPEPSVLVGWLQIGTITTGEITLAARRPNETNTRSGNSLLDEFILLWRLQGDGIHTMSSANVTGIQPIDLERTSRSMLPTEEIRMCYAAGISVGWMSDSYKKFLKKVIIIKRQVKIILLFCCLKKIFL